MTSVVINIKKPATYVTGHMKSCKMLLQTGVNDALKLLFLRHQCL